MISEDPEYYRNVILTKCLLWKGYFEEIWIKCDGSQMQDR